MDLDDVRIFTKVVQAGSFTAAARQLGVPKSRVSRRVSALEEALGARLLHRTTRRQRLTDLGEVYFARTSRVIAELEDAQRAISQLQAEPRGLLRVTAPPDLATTVLVDMVCPFRQRYPEIQLAIFSTGRMVDLVAEGYDVALRAGRMPDSSLVARRLATSRRKLYASRAYLECRGTPQRLEDLEHHDCLLFGVEGGSEIWSFDGPDGQEQVRVTGPLATNDYGVLRRVTAAGLGIGWLPRTAIVSGDDLMPILEEYSSDGGGLFAVYPSPRHLTPKVRAFIDFVQAFFKQAFAEA